MDIHGLRLVDWDHREVCELYNYRKCEAKDYEAIAAIRNQVTVEQVTGDALRQSDAYTAAQPDSLITRIVAEDAVGTVIGYALVAHFSGMTAGRWWIHVTIAPELQRRGIGRGLYQVAEEWVRERGGTEVESVCTEDPAEKNYGFALSRGFHSDRKRFQMDLDLSQWDRAAAGRTIARIHTPGIAVDRFPAEPSGDLLRSLYDLHTATERDVPSFEGVQPDFAQWAADFRQKERLAVVVAREGERVVAASFIQLPDEKATGCYIPHTGVLREYRGKGLARAVKLAALNLAHERGYPFAWTHNDLDNPAITSINLSLGFRQLPGLYRLKKRLA